MVDVCHDWLDPRGANPRWSLWVFPVGWFHRHSPTGLQGLNMFEDVWTHHVQWERRGAAVVLLEKPSPALFESIWTSLSLYIYIYDSYIMLHLSCWWLHHQMVNPNDHHDLSTSGHHSRCSPHFWQGRCGCQCWSGAPRCDTMLRGLKFLYPG